MSWFVKKYTKAATGTPVIIHPLRTLGGGASEVEAMRIMTENELEKLRKALADIAKSLGDPDILNCQKQANELLATHGFNVDEFLKRYYCIEMS